MTSDNHPFGAMPSLLYESKASFIKRLAEFNPNSTNNNSKLFPPLPVPQHGPMKEVQEFQVGL